MTRLEKGMGKRQPDPHVSHVTYLFLRREHYRLTTEAAYWRAMAHYWFLQAQAKPEQDDVAWIVAHAALVEIHRRSIPELTEEDAPWLATL